MVEPQLDLLDQHIERNNGKQDMNTLKLNADLRDTRREKYTFSSCQTVYICGVCMFASLEGVKANGASFRHINI